MIIPRLVAVGESTFKGFVGGGENINYSNPERLASHLGIGVDNLARSGQSIYGQRQLGVLTETNIAAQKGSIAVINMGLNDAWQRNTNSQWINDAVALVNAFKRAGKRVIVQPSNEVDVNAIYTGGTVGELANGRTFAQAVKDFGSLLRQVAQDRGCLFTSQGTTAVGLDDGLHPSGSGYNTMLDGLKGTVTQALVTEVRNYQSAALMYCALLQRAAEKDGLDYWAPMVPANFDNGQMATWMLGAPECQALYPLTDSNETFVSKVYLNVAGRQGDAEGIAYWASVIQGYQNQGFDKQTARGKTVTVMVDMTYNYSGTDAGAIKSQKLLQNRLNVGLAYGYIFKKTAVDGTLAAGTNGTVSGYRNVTDDPATVVAATASYI